MRSNIFTAAFVALATASTATAQCTHFIDGVDTFGDGWNGASITINVNMTPALPSFMVAPVPGTQTTGSFMANTGDTIDTTFVSGFFDNEIIYTIFGGDPTGMLCNVIGGEDATISPIVGLTGLTGDCNGTGACPPPPPMTPANDNCANAAVIPATGPYSWENTLATLDGAADGLCEIDNVPDIFSDVWYEWTAPTDDLYTVTSVGLSNGFDTKIGVYETCGAQPISCGDQDVGNETTTIFRATMGSAYLVRIGSFSAVAQSGPAMFDITAGAVLPAVQTTAMNMANGNTYHLLEASDWPTAQIAAEELGGNLVTVDNQAEHDFILATFFGAGTDIWTGLNDRAVEGTFEWVSGLAVGYTNFMAGEPNDGSLAGEDFVHLNMNDPMGLWNDLNGSEPDVNGNNQNTQGLVEVGDGGLEVCNGDGGDQMGCTDCPCGNNAPQGTIGGCINSAGTSMRIIRSGSSSIATMDLRFEASGAPPSNSCQLTSGNALAPANMANPCFGLNSGIQSVNLDGLRCVVQSVLRHGVRPSDANGDVGVTTNGWGMPNGFFNFAAFSTGQTKHFQIINRDDAAQVCQTGQNTSQASSVTFGT